MGDRRVRVLCGIAAGVATGCALLGVYLCKRSLPARSHEKAKELIEHDGGKAVRSTDGLRTVEYFVAGSMLPTARVCIIFSGAAVTAKYVAHLVHATAERLNTRVIAITLPGWGYSTIHRRLVYSEWAATDLKPILEAEKVRRFAVAGTSLGCPFAMAVAAALGPSYILALGLRVPFLPKAITDEVGLPEYPAHLPDTLLSDALPYGWAAHLAMLPLFHPWLVGAFDRLRQGAAHKKCRSDYPDEFDLAYHDMKRGTAVYGYRAMMASLRRSTVLDWGFDPREIRVSKKLVWYAADDADCPPSHGRWLADHFAANAVSERDVKVRIFDGYGHLGGACFEWHAFLEDLMGQVAAGAPKASMLTRC